MEKAIKAMGGRKIILGLLLVGIGVALETAGPGLSDNMSNFLLMIGIGYFGVNVTGKMANGVLELVKTKNKKAAAPTIDMKAIEAAVAAATERAVEEKTETIDATLAAISNRQAVQDKSLNALLTGTTQILNIAQGTGGR